MSSVTYWVTKEDDPIATSFPSDVNPETSDTEPGLAGHPGAARGLAAVEARLLRKPDRRQLAALALLYAAEGREQALLRMAGAALEAGVDPDRILDAIRALPRARQGAALAAVLGRNPDVDFDGFRAAQIFEESGDPARALTVVREALPAQRGFDPDLTRYLLHLDPEGAPAFLFELEEANTWRGEDLQALIGFLVESGQEHESLAFVERALDTDPKDQDTLRVLARIAPREAVQRLRALVEDDPSDVQAWARLGTILRRQGDLGGAFSALQQAATLKPSRSAYEDLMRTDPHRALPLIKAWTEGERDDEAIGLLARAYLRAGQQGEAVATFLRAHEGDPDDSEWIRGLIRSDPQQAVTSLAAQIAKSPAAAEEDLLGHYGDALRAAGRTDDSFDQYLNAHRKDPDDKDWQVAMAHVDPERALPVLEAFLRDDPDDASGRGAYGVALASMGRTAEAAKQLERAMRRGDAGKWYTELAKLDSERALRALRQRARRDRGDDEMWGTLGRALRKLGRDDEARAAFRRALALDPADADWAAALRR
ncbi:MAG: tetratricopeptide repeat protein [bacterium]|nr:tetratricopeptide repeat protein [bacterium]